MKLLATIIVIGVTSIGIQQFGVTGNIVEQVPTVLINQPYRSPVVNNTGIVCPAVGYPMQSSDTVYVGDDLHCRDCHAGVYSQRDNNERRCSACNAIEQNNN